VQATGVNRPRVQNFNREVLQTDEIFALVIVAPDQQCGEPCGKVKNVLGKLAGKMGHMMKFGTMLHSDQLPNPAEDNEMQSVGEIFGVVNTTAGTATIPHLLVWESGPKLMNKVVSMPAQYLMHIVAKGPKSAWAQLRNFVPSMVETANTNKLQEWMTKRLPAAPRVLLFTEKLGSSVLYKKLSVDFAGRALFGESSKFLEDMAELFGVTEYPTLLVSPPGPHSLKEEAYKAWKRYEGDMEYAAIKTFLQRNVPDKSTPLVHSPATWKKHCADAEGVCIIAAVEDDAVARKRQLEVFDATVSRAFVKVDMEGFQRGSVQATDYPVSFMALDGERQADLRSLFDVPAVPSVIAVNPRKKAFSVMKGSFNEKNVYEFVMGMLLGEGMELRTYDREPLVNTVAPTAAATGSKSGGGGKKKVKKVRRKKKAKKAPKAAAADKAEL